MWFNGWMMNNYFGMMWPGNWGAHAWAWPLAGAFLAFFIFVCLTLWVYTSLAYMGIARKLKYKNSWLAWIPFARGAMILQLGGFNWGWIFLALIPIAGWIALCVLFYISNWRIFEKRKYSGWLALIPLIGMIVPWLMLLSGIAYLVVLGFVAWQDNKKRRR